MPKIILLQMGKEKDLVEERAWSRELGKLNVKVEKAKKMMAVLADDTPVGTVLVIQVLNSKRGRMEEIWRKEGKLSGVPEDALIEARTPAGRKPSKVVDINAKKAKGEKPPKRHLPSAK